ncbi:unnamed protein product [Protopolystoma xenopodis]|uniref:Coatomer subunit gamma C-terminal domain-containing protein n=1 Tax=Protopolystoma xenopodis TaxID=117903 RepID=A0A3S5CI71_9PLAT|nr:unnamed protein product [Protopolystoma xenopodis]
MKALVEHFGMHPWNRSDHLPQGTKSAHVLQLHGMFRGNHEVLARCKLARISGTDPNAGITLQISVRSKSSEVNRAVADSLC